MCLRQGSIVNFPENKDFKYHCNVFSNTTEMAEVPDSKSGSRANKLNGCLVLARV